MYFSCYTFRPPKRSQDGKCPLSKEEEQRPKSSLHPPRGEGLCPSRHWATQPLTRPNRGTKRWRGNGRENAFSLYCVSGSDMRQEPCSAFFLKIGLQAAQSGAGHLPQQSAWLPTASQALCWPHPRADEISPFNLLSATVSGSALYGGKMYIWLSPVCFRLVGSARKHLETMCLSPSSWLTVR